MAVAVKHAPETASRGLWNSLPVASLLGVIYVLASLAVVFSVLPSVWRTAVAGWLAPAAGEFINLTLLGLVMLAVAGALAIFGARLVGPQSPAGLRAGICFGLMAILLVGLLTKWASLWIEHWSYYGHLFGDAGQTGGALATSAVGIVLLGLTGWLFLKPGCQQWLITVEEQGWFTNIAYKRSQGQRVRRGTILGMLVLVGAGIYTLLHGHRLEGVGDWAMPIPFTGIVQIKQENDAAVILDQLYPDRDRGELTLDRYALRNVNENLMRNYDRIADPGVGTEFEIGQVVSKTAFTEVLEAQQKRIDQLDSDAKKLEEGGQPLQARTRRQEAEKLREQLPKVEAPVPAADQPIVYASLTLLPAVRLTLPLLLAAAGIWLAWRIVNLPVFADFLIATEAEMNKVSWTTRRRLVQDTIVVLTTVILLTLFLLFADILWSFGLRKIGVVQFGNNPVKAPDSEQKVPKW